MLIRTAIIVLVAAAAGLIGWRVLAPQGNAPDTAKVTATAPAGSDYYMRDATIYQMSKTGQLAYRMQLDQMLHYPNGSARLHDINARYEAGTSTWWSLQAADGRVPPDSHDIFLMGGVVLRHPKPDGKTVVIHTDHAWVRTKTNIIETKAHATATSPGRKVESDGLRITLNNDHMKLLDNVQVRYKQ